MLAYRIEMEHRHKPLPSRHGVSDDLYIKGAQLFDQQKGKVTAYSITNVSLNSNNGVNTAMLTVRVTRNGSPYDVHLQLLQESSGWKINSIDSL